MLPSSLSSYPRPPDATCILTTPATFASPVVEVGGHFNEGGLVAISHTHSTYTKLLLIHISSSFHSSLSTSLPSSLPLLTRCLRSFTLSTNDELNPPELDLLLPEEGEASRRLNLLSPRASSPKHSSNGRFLDDESGHKHWLVGWGVVNQNEILTFVALEDNQCIVKSYE